MQPSRNSLVDIKERLISLENTLADPLSDLNIERILDVFISAALDSQRAPRDKQDTQILAFSERFAESVRQLLGLRRQRHDFTFLATLGRGAYGRVDLVRENATGRVCAMKTLDKSKMLSQQADFWAEREIMAQSVSPWIVRLFYSFQDVRSLYMVMEYVPGGTLVCWMDEAELISETVCRFYAAEITQALSDLHAMGFIHRDIKPDNMLLDMSGHLKLADFGTCVRVDPHTHRVRCESAVGTPDYISPEVLYSQSSGGGEYGFAVDWWALGILVYEMICGETPFYSDDLVTTYSKIMSHTTSLHLPKEIAITPSCLDFIKRLLSPEEVRLGSGSGGAEEVRNHAWFAPTWPTAECLPARVNEHGDEAFFDWTWKTLRSISPGPFHPNLASETDTSYFREDVLQPEHEDLEEATSVVVDEVEPGQNGDSGCDTFNGSQLSFAGFTFSSPKLAPLSGIYLAPPQSLLHEVSSYEEVQRIDKEAKNERESSLQAQRIHELEEALAQAELQLASSEARFVESLSDAERRMEVLKLEHASAMHQMETEVSKLKAMAESERKARQSAEAQKAKAVDLLAKRATDMADRLTATVGQSSGAPLQRRQASLPVEMPSTSGLSTGEGDAAASPPAPTAFTTADSSAGVATTSDFDATSASGGGADVTTSAATELLLKRIQELVDRAQQADEQLQIERRFAELYKKACEEKEDQLTERDQRIASLVEALETAKQSKEQAQLATRHALMEEQERSAQYLECLKAAEKSSEVANRRAQIATSEVVALRDDLNVLREDLSKAHEDLATEKLKCSAAVNKIQQILSGENADALELMMLSEMESMRRSAETGGLSGVSMPSDGHPTTVALKSKSAKKFTSQQHLFRHLDRKYKRLVSEYEQMQTKHRLEMKEARTMFHASQESAQIARNQVIHLSEEVAALQIQLNAVNTALKAAVADAAASATSTTATLHRIPAPLGNAGGARTLRSRLARKTTGEAEHQLTAEAITPEGESEADHLPPLEMARSPTRLHRVSSLSSPRRPLLVPSASIGGLPLLPSPLPINFCFSGHLDMPGKPGRRKKLVWDQRFAKLTFSRFLVWDTVKALDSAQSSAPIDSLVLPLEAAATSSSAGSATSSRKISRPGPNLLLDLPLNAILHVRSVTSCDVLHAPAEDLPRIFQIIFDQCEAGGASGGGIRQALEARVSSPDSSPHCATSPSKPSQSTGLLGISKTLPRKLSFSASGTFSTGAAKALQLGPAVALKSRTNSSGQILSHAVSSDPLLTSIPCPGTAANPIPLQGHMLQRIHFRVPAVCELCKRACWHVISPPPALQCLHCQVKLHLSHLEKRDYVLRPCGKSTAILLFRAPSEEAKLGWLKNLQSAISNAAISTTTPPLPPPQFSSLSLCSTTVARDDRPKSLGTSGMVRGPTIMRSATLPYTSRTATPTTNTTTTTTSSSSNSAAASSSKVARFMTAAVAAEEAELDEEDVFLDSPISKNTSTALPLADADSEQEQPGVVEI
ncbi:rho associated protein kinase 1 [Echinococcus multilocularis]|uniref:non-specific serine/threonine protein kinase n=1 Tax=Echinococcus multilocularis TaxID=6211 RepID=A0A087VXN0_ECHMU|nr:rho associated protein kinase 1 [Echinococcus multilocularis]